MPNLPARTDRSSRIRAKVPNGRCPLRYCNTFFDLQEAVDLGPPQDVADFGPQAGEHELGLFLFQPALQRDQLASTVSLPSRWTFEQSTKSALPAAQLVRNSTCWSILEPITSATIIILLRSKVQSNYCRCAGNIRASYEPANPQEPGPSQEEPLERFD